MNQITFFPARRIAGALVAGLVIGAAGCVVGGPQDSLRHIRTPSVVRSAPRQDKLVAELRSPKLQQGWYTAAEQIAVYAGYELERGNEWDAAVLLSIASYRYHQQAYLALALGNSQSYMINPAAAAQFEEWVGLEVRTFNDQHFDREIELLRRHLFGFAVAAERRDAYLEEIARGGKEDAAIDQHLTALQTEMSNRPERLAYPALAEAFLARLVDDHGRDSKNSFAYYYMAATPLDSYRLAALDGTMAPFDSVLAQNLVPRLATLRQAVRARLDHHRVYTRAMATALLGFAPDAGDVALLEARLAEETNPLVLDSLRFALIQNGKDEHMAGLVQHAAQGTAEEERNHSLTMLLWLPEARKLQLDEAFFVELARNEPGMSKEGRILALAMLRDLAREKALAQGTVIAALELTADADAQVAATAASVVSAMEQLGGAECKALYQRYPKARAALLERLAQSASLADLDFLSQAYDAHAREMDVQLAAAGAVTAIPGAASLQLLRRWLEAASRQDDQRPFLTLVTLLAMRADVAEARLGQLDLPRAKRFMVEIALDHEKLARTARSLEQPHTFSSPLNGLRLQDAAQIAILSGLLHRPALVTTLWNLARYRNDELYPGDAMVRRQAIGALVRMQLQRRTQRTARAVAGR